MALDLFENLLGFELLEHDVLSPHTGHILRCAPAIDVKQGDGMELDIALFDAYSDCCFKGMQVEIAMGEHHTLASIGGA